ncbi:cob(I)yrinic acid a,c-diamide adenosyltransferase [Candidatus Woesebacteria bacterium]|nr:cob(I)yrinic acid a,c-diamide adenosyltransferase [Candidatus Woesebacteria bacterium]MCD8507086.1 cob(I)yrinic acid a,c-diamide adenosyltransferase [Candidatus Woesebacteria bacterium]MCD8527206.1 cob(I)yrinic acid a,c-diamide adenosyltransferase [Candidatus Woesebacteria bacterium]MCD8546571.1 cob(I)yrinic acid a,c-diamide adenosyltransferase [Candidatus Woesebacteria bacterium]
MTPSTQNSGLVYVFTGDGKGKTSAALGVAIRGLAHGWNVDWIAFYKELSWNISEFSLPELLVPQAQERFSLHILGKGFYLPETADTVGNKKKSIKVASVGKSGTVIDDDTPEQHLQAALAAITKAHDLLQQSVPPELLILDEVCNALSDGLLNWEKVQPLLQNRGKTHVVLTGRNAIPELLDAADLVSSIEKVKHPYDSGQLAVKGLDF